MIHRHRGNRRWQDTQKALSKKHIAEVKNLVTYQNLGEYDKGKIYTELRAMCARRAKHDNSLTSRPASVLRQIMGFRHAVAEYYSEAIS